MNTQKNSRTAKRESAYDKMEDYLTERLDFEVIYKIANSPNGMQLKELVAAFQEEWEETSGVKKILSDSITRLKNKRQIIRDGHSTTGRYVLYREYEHVFRVRCFLWGLMDSWKQDRQDSIKKYICEIFLKLGPSFECDNELFDNFIDVLKTPAVESKVQSLKKFDEQNMDDSLEFDELPLLYQYHLAKLGIYYYFCWCAKQRFRFRTILKDVKNPVIQYNPVYFVAYYRALKKFYQTGAIEDFLRIRKELDAQFFLDVAQMTKFLEKTFKALSRKNKDPKYNKKLKLYLGYLDFLKNSDFTENQKGQVEDYFNQNITEMKEAGFGKATSFLREFQRERQVLSLPIWQQPGNFCYNKLFIQVGFP